MFTKLKNVYQTIKSSKRVQKVIKRKKLIVGGVAGGAVFFFKEELTDQFHHLAHEIEKLEARHILMKPIQYFEDPNYVERKDIEQQLNEESRNKLFGERYFVVIGLRGTGKKSLIRHIFNGEKGIVHIRYDQNTIVHKMEEQLLEALNMKISNWNSYRILRVFGKICHPIRKIKDTGEVEWTPTVIIDVAEGTPKSLVFALPFLAKHISIDHRQANCILVLEDPSDILEISRDHLIQKYINVGDFTEEEANKYLDKMEYPKEGRDQIFKNIGTRPLFLREMVESKMKGIEFIEKKIQKDYQLISQCCSKHPESFQLIQSMLELYETKGKCELHSFYDTETGMSVIDLPIVKTFNILQFCLDSFSFEFQSKTMQEAAKRYIDRVKLKPTE